MEAQDIVLAALSCGKGELYTPVQVQKLFFLIDRNISHRIGGPFFDFQPYNYGPFDPRVYDTLVDLHSKGSVEIFQNGRWKEYRLSLNGQNEGDQILSKMDADIQQYISALSQFVRSLTFTQLVSAVYKAYPEMKVNSVFREQS